MVGTAASLSKLDLSAVTMVVIDEADSVWAHQEAPLRTIMGKVPPACGRMFLSATFSAAQKTERITICKQSVNSEKPSESHIIAVAPSGSEKGMVALM